MKKRISDLIGDNYKKWKSGSTVIIDSYTGSGKTYFVRDILLPYAIKNKKKIVYFCNRKSLKEQVDGFQRNKTIFIDGEEFLASDYFHVISYQYCETINKFPDFCIEYDKLHPNEKIASKNKKSKIYIQQDEVLYYIFDEAHYFVMDSSFNKKNSFWFEQKFKFKNSVSIFLTATPDPFYLFYFFNNNKELLNSYLYDFIFAAENRNRAEKEMIDAKSNYYIAFREEKIKYAELNRKNNNKKNIYDNIVFELDNILKIFKPSLKPVSLPLLEEKENNTVEMYIYSMDKSFSNYKHHYFLNYDFLIDKIVNSNCKWLIFIDSEEDGRYLESRLNTKRFGKDYVTSIFIEPFAVFLSARTKNNSIYAAREYNNIVNNEQFNCDVLIATSIIDCGVNIKDESLNNIIIAQPDKTEFVQMLGRLRETENRTINLYIKYVEEATKNAFSNLAKRNISYAVAYETFKYYSKRRFGYYNEMAIENNKIKLIDAIINNTLPTIITFSKNRKQPFEKESANINILRDVKINKSNLIYNLYNIWQYYDRYKESEDNSSYSWYDFPNELNWADKKYFADNWVGYKENLQQITDYLETYKQSGYLDSEVYNEFKQTLFKMILDLPSTFLPEQIKKDKTRYKNDRIPSISKLNDTLSFLGFNYIIKSKRSNGKTKWFIISSNELM